jgi:hypothetical protein
MALSAFLLAEQQGLETDPSFHAYHRQKRGDPIRFFWRPLRF